MFNIFGKLDSESCPVHLLLCLSEGEAAGEGMEVRGAGTGHWRIGSSVTCPLSFSAIMNSVKRDNELIRFFPNV